MIQQQSLSASDGSEFSDGSNDVSDPSENLVDQQTDPGTMGDINNIDDVDAPIEPVTDLCSSSSPPPTILPSDSVSSVKASPDPDKYPTSPVIIPKLKSPLLPEPGAIQNYSKFVTPPANPNYPDDL